MLMGKIHQDNERMFVLVEYLHNKDCPDVGYDLHLSFCFIICGSTWNYFCHLDFYIEKSKFL